jgi:hypothetical protein
MISFFFKYKVMKFRHLAALFFMLPMLVFAQLHQSKPNTIANSGMFSLGMRNTLSLFNSHNAPSFGAGGHFRIRLSERVNTEWYADFIKSKVDNQLARLDAHIGWSVMYYWLSTERTKIFQPFFEAGHCFDFTKLTNAITNDNKQRLNSAMQMGIGLHFNITERLDFTYKSQYMLHLGGHIHAEKNSTGIYEISEHIGFQAEGHWLNTVSVNYKIIRIWKKSV